MTKQVDCSSMPMPVFPRKSRNKAAIHLLKSCHPKWGNPPMTGKIEPTERQLAGAAAGADHILQKFDERWRALNDLQRKSDPVKDLQSSDDKLSKAFGDLLRPSPQQEPATNDVLSGISHRLDDGTSERKAISDRLVAIEHQPRGSGGFTRYLVAILIGVAATLAWQSYGEATKQIIAASAPKLGWSPEAKQMIASGIQQLGWTKPSAGPENIAPQQKASTAPSLDPAQVQQMVQGLAALRESVQQLAQTVDRLAAAQDQMARAIDTVQAAKQEKIPESPHPPPIAAAPAAAGRPAPGGSPGRAATEVALRASCGPDVQRLCRGISLENGGVIKCLNSHRMELSPTCDMYFNEMPVHRAAQTEGHKPVPVQPPSSRAPIALPSTRQ
jgi:hypothetical protein